MLPLCIDQKYNGDQNISEIRDYFNNFANDLTSVIPEPLKLRLLDLRDYATGCITTSDGLMEDFNSQVPVRHVRETFDSLFQGVRDKFLTQIDAEITTPSTMVSNAMIQDFLRESFHNLRYAKNAYVRFLTALYNKKRGDLINNELNTFYMYFNNARDSFIEAVLSTTLSE